MSAVIACVGHASVDHHFEIEAFAQRPTKTPARSYEQLVGGMAANAAVALARLGAQVRLLGRVGDDEAGRFVRRQLEQLGVQPQLETVPGSHTSVSSVVVDAQGERQIFNHAGSALAQAHALELAQLDGAQALLTDPRWAAGAWAALTWARQRGLLGVLDADIAPAQVLHRLVPLAQWAVFSENGLRCFAPDLGLEQGLRAALAAGAQGAMVTLGAQGVAWTQGGPLQRQGAYAIEALDTTGAGDVFHAAFTLALVQGMHEGDAARYACAAAAIKCSRRHGVMGAPRHAEVLDFMRQMGQEPANSQYSLL